MKRQKICGVYIIKNKINNKFYIGSSINIKRRWNEHKSLLRNNKHHNKHLQNAWNKYGEKNFEFDILKKVKLVKNKKEYKKLLDLERQYILKYDACNYGYNITDVTRINENKFQFCMSDETKEKLRNKIVTTKARDNMRKAHLFESLPIVQLNLEGNLIKEWISARNASKKLHINQSCIWECLNKGRKTYKNYIWIYKEEYEEINHKIDLNYYVNNQGQKISIIQLNLKGEFIKIWDSASSIQNETNKYFDASAVIKICKHKSYSSKGNIFLYYKNDMNIYKEFINHINCYNNIHPKRKKIYQIDKNNKIIKIWNNIQEIIKKYKYTGFYEYINKEWNGFKWETYYNL